MSSVDVVVLPDEFLDLVSHDQVDSTLNHSPDHLVSSPNLLPDIPTLTSDLPTLNTTVPAPIRRSHRPHNPPFYLHDYHCNLVSAHVLASVSLTQSHESTAACTSGIPYPLSSILSYSKLLSPHRIFSVTLSITKEPDTYAQALKDPLWRAAMQAEIDSLVANRT